MRELFIRSAHEEPLRADVMKRGFTLIECVLILLLLALTATLLVPYISAKREQAAVIEMMTRGRNLYVLIYHSEAHWPIGLNQIQDTVIEKVYPPKTKYLISWQPSKEINHLPLDISGTSLKRNSYSKLKIELDFFNIS